MSSGIKRPYEQVLRIALQMVERLQPVCERIEIAGSLRRKKPEIGDIELIAVPILDRNLLDEVMYPSPLDRMLAGWPITLAKNGNRQKQFIFKASGGTTYQIDLFLQPDPATWGVNLLLRTGSAEFSKRMAMHKRHGGWMPDDLVMEGAKIKRDGVIIPTPEERDVFELWGMEYIEPEDREWR